MAAKKHLHERRGITFVELGALLGTRAMLQMGLVRHTPKEEPLPKKHLFNMGIACETEECGSIGCIGGTMGMLMGMDSQQAQNYVGRPNGNGTRSESLHSLFYPPEDRGYCGTSEWWSTITAAQAVKAIDNWLANGKPRWLTVRKMK